MCLPHYWQVHRGQRGRREPLPLSAATCLFATHILLLSHRQYRVVSTKTSLPFGDGCSFFCYSHEDLHKTGILDVMSAFEIHSSLKTEPNHKIKRFDFKNDYTENLK